MIKNHMNKAFECIAISKLPESKEGASVTVDLHIVDTADEAITEITNQAKRNNPDKEVVYAAARELDIPHLIKDWLDGKKTGNNYYDSEQFEFKYDPSLEVDAK